MDNSFYSCLYSEKTTPDVLYEYCNPMSESSNPIKRLEGKRLLSFCGQLKDQVFYRQVKNAFKLICQEIDGKFPDVPYQLLGRIKSLISLLNKAEEIEASTIEHQKEAFIKTITQDTDEKNELLMKLNNNDVQLTLEFIEYLSHVIITPNPFNDIRDFFAFRIVIEDRKVGNCITEMYNIANFLIKLFDEKSQFELLPSKPIEENKEKKTIVDPEFIYIPEKTGILNQYVSFVKDYVVNPKPDGYQGLHIVVHDPMSDRDFEIQIRTRSMDMVTETYANHQYYKAKKYHNRMTKLENSIDYSKIQVEGFRYMKYIDPQTGEPKELISDQAGIIESIPISMETENFFKHFLF